LSGRPTRSARFLAKMRMPSWPPTALPNTAMLRQAQHAALRQAQHAALRQAQRMALRARASSS
jgi:hypothetical protein